MLSVPPRALDPLALHIELPGDPPMRLDAPDYLVTRYLELTSQRRAIEEQIAVIRAELEVLAVSSLSAQRPRGRFQSNAGHVSARLTPTCLFDREAVARALAKAGRLAEVAAIPGPALARFLATDPVLKARLGDAVRYRSAVVLTAAQ